MSWADAVAREASWFTTDPPASFPTAPALQAKNGGPFDTVEAYIPALFPRSRALYIYRVKVDEHRIAFGGVKEYEHHFVARILWPYSAPAGGLESALAELDLAVDKVLTRLRGPVGDKSHGGAFLQVGEHPSDIAVEWSDPYADVINKQPFNVAIHYLAIETIVA